MTRRCSECGHNIDGRADRQTCSARCRVARSRRLGTKENPIRVEIDPCPLGDGCPVCNPAR